MKSLRITLAALSLALLVCAVPVSAQNQDLPPQQNWPPPQNWTPPMQNPWLPPGSQQAQAASGKVVAFTATSLTLEAQEAGAAKNIDFVIDGNTKIDGELAKDANAQVTYRVDQGKNIAISVRVLA